MIVRQAKRSGVYLTRVDKNKGGATEGKNQALVRNDTVLW